MSVNFLLHLVFGLFLLLEKTIQQAASGNSGTKTSKPAQHRQPICRKTLLNFLRLTGHEKGNPVRASKICPIPANDNCCSQIDEIKIVKSWNSFTLPKLEKYAEDMSLIYHDFANIEPYLKRLNSSNIEYHFDHISWRKTNQSQCFSGKFFLEQSNYDIVKMSENVTGAIIHAFARQVALNLTEGNRSTIIRRTFARRFIRRMLSRSRTQQRRFINSIGSTAIDEFASTFAAIFGDRLSREMQPNVTIKELPRGMSRIEFLEQNLNFTLIILQAARNVSNGHFMNVMQSRAAHYHVLTMMNYMDTTFRGAVERNWQIRARGINPTNLILEIMDELFDDPVLRRYFGWFMVPTSRNRYIRVYKYLENRFYKTLSDSIAKSAELSEHAHYAVLKEMMGIMAHSGLRSILWHSYQMIAGSVISQLSLNEYIPIVLNTAGSTLTPGRFYQMMVRQIYRNTTFRLELLEEPSNNWLFQNNNHNHRPVWRLANADTHRMQEHLWWIAQRVVRISRGRFSLNAKPGRKLVQNDIKNQNNNNRTLAVALNDTSKVEDLPKNVQVQIPHRILSEKSLKLRQYSNPQERNLFLGNLFGRNRRRRRGRRHSWDIFNLFPSVPNSIRIPNIVQVIQPSTLAPIFNRAANRFMNFNFRMARFAEFTGDNKRVCATVFRHSLIREAIFNEAKFSYCMRIDEAYDSNSAAATLGPLQNLKTQVWKILELKSAFYCAACSSRASRNINMALNTITLSKEFCFNFILTHKDYLNWRFTIFYNYQNIIYQYLSCFGRNANLTDHIPYESNDGLLPDNFTDWEGCSRMTSIQNISLCTSVCKKITLTNWGAWIEGDRQNLRRLYNYALSVMRMYGIQRGAFDVYRASNTTAPPKNKRILEELRKERAVVYDLKPKGLPRGRVLEALDVKTRSRLYKRNLAEQSKNQKPASNNSSHGKASNVKKNNTKSTPKALEGLLGDPHNAMFYKLLITAYNMTEYTRKEHYHHDELTGLKVNYKLTPTINDIRNMTVNISPNGINPLRFLERYQFKSYMLISLTTNQKGQEKLQKEIIRDCVAVDKKDVKAFNSDHRGINFHKKYLDPKDDSPIIGDVNIHLFLRNVENLNVVWHLPGKNLDEKKIGKTSRHLIEKKLEKEEENKQPLSQKVKEFMTKLLLKVWF